VIGSKLGRKEIEFSAGAKGVRPGRNGKWKDVKAGRSVGGEEVLHGGGEASGLGKGDPCDEREIKGFCREAFLGNGCKKKTGEIWIKQGRGGLGSSEGRWHWGRRREWGGEWAGPLANYREHCVELKRPSEQLPAPVLQM